MKVKFRALPGLPTKCFASIFQIKGFNSKELSPLFEEDENLVSQKRHHFLMSTYSSTFILRTDRPKKNGECPIMLRCLINGEKIVLSPKLSVLPKHWDKKTQKTKRTPKDSEELTRELNHIDAILALQIEKFSKITRTALYEDRLMTASEFEEKFKHGISIASVNGFIGVMIKELTPDRAHSTIKAYNTLLEHLNEFRAKLAFSELTPKFLDEFNRYLKQVKGNKINSQWTKLKNLKMFVNLAIRKGYKFENPFINFKFKAVYAEKVFLTKDEVNLLADIDPLELTEKQQLTLRMFLFSCWSGLRISDVQQLTDSHIIGNELVFLPVKTKRKNTLLRVPLNSTARKYIQHFQGKLFDSYSEQHINKDLKIIVGKVPAIKKHVTFHTARHTFGMMFMEVKDNKIEVLQQIMGHSDISTTQVYLHIRGESKHEAMNRMDQYSNRAASPE